MNDWHYKYIKGRAKIHVLFPENLNFSQNAITSLTFTIIFSLQDGFIWLLRPQIFIFEPIIFNYGRSLIKINHMILDYYLANFVKKCPIKQFVKL